MGSFINFVVVVDVAAIRAPLVGSCRLTLSLMCLCGTLIFFLMRLNLSFALVCMVRPSSASSPAPTDDDIALVDDAQSAINRSYYVTSIFRYSVQFQGPFRRLIDSSIHRFIDSLISVTVIVSSVPLRLGYWTSH